MDRFTGRAAFSPVSQERFPVAYITAVTATTGAVSQRRIRSPIEQMCSPAILARIAGLHICSMGERILRCETAPVVAVTAVMYATGNLS